jgi:hypothetical protein
LSPGIGWVGAQWLVAKVDIDRALHLGRRDRQEGAQAPHLGAPGDNLIVRSETVPTPTAIAAWLA